MEVQFVLVDWERMHEEWPKGEVEPEWNDDQSDWYASPSHGLDTDSAAWNAEIGDLFWGMADYLDEEEYTKLGNFLSAFAVTIREDDPEEEFQIPWDIDGREFMYVSSSLSPATVRDFLERRKELSMKAILAAAESALEDGGSDLESADGLREFIDLCTETLKEAEAQGRGMLVLCIG